jgi:hypothetical protein
VKPLGSLLRDGWVIGIACAAALAYTTVRLVDEALAVLFAIGDGPPAAAYEGGPEELFEIPYSVTINGHLVYLEPLLRSAVLFVLTVVASAAALYATRGSEDDTA